MRSHSISKGIGSLLIMILSILMIGGWGQSASPAVAAEAKISALRITEARIIRDQPRETPIYVNDFMTLQFRYEVDKAPADVPTTAEIHFPGWLSLLGPKQELTLYARMRPTDADIEVGKCVAEGIGKLVCTIDVARVPGDGVLSGHAEVSIKAPREYQNIIDNGETLDLGGAKFPISDLVDVTIPGNENVILRPRQDIPPSKVNFGEPKKTGVGVIGDGTQNYVYWSLFVDGTGQDMEIVDYLPLYSQLSWDGFDSATKVHPGAQFFIVAREIGSAGTWNPDKTGKQNTVVSDQPGAYSLTVTPAGKLPEPGERAIMRLTIKNTLANHRYFIRYWTYAPNQNDGPVDSNTRDPRVKTTYENGDEIINTAVVDGNEIISNPVPASGYDSSAGDGYYFAKVSVRKDIIGDNTCLAKANEQVLEYTFQLTPGEVFNPNATPAPASGLPMTNETRELRVPAGSIKSIKDLIPGQVIELTETQVPPIPGCNWSQKMQISADNSSAARGDMQILQQGERETASVKLHSGRTYQIRVINELREQNTPEPKPTPQTVETPEPPASDQTPETAEVPPATTPDPTLPDTGTNPGTTPELPKTGTDALAMAEVFLVAGLLGLTLVTLSRRRQR